MNKRCTASACRRVFSTLHANGICPHCGKYYPQLDTHEVYSVYLDASSCSYKLRAIKRLRDLFPGIGLKDAKDSIDGKRPVEIGNRRIYTQLVEAMSEYAVIASRHRKMQNA